MQGGSLAIGAASIMAGVTILGITDNLVRFVAEEAGLWQFHLTRSAFALPLLLAGVLAFGLALRPRRPARVAARTAAHASAMLLYFGALPVLPVAQVAACLFTAPIWVLVFGRLLFGQPIGPWRLLAVVLGFLGVLVMLRPDPATFSPVLLMPLAAGALYGLGNLLTRHWCADEPVAVLVGGFFLALAAASLIALGLIALLRPSVEAAPFLLTGWRAPGAPFLFWTAIQAAGTVLAIGLIYHGYQSGETGGLAVFEYAFLPVAALTAWLLWEEALDPAGMAGIGLIVAAGLVVTWRSVQADAQARPAGSGRG